MKRINLILTIAILFPAVIMAQQDDHSLKHDDTPADLVLPAESSGSFSSVSPFVPGHYSNASSFAGAPSSTQQTSKAGKPPAEIKRPSIEGSMVGYIDNAIVGSQIRIRFDAAFDDNFPDRAEFFYAKCRCYRNPGLGVDTDPNAPGPGPGIPTTLNFQQLYLNGEYAPNSRFSVFTEVPIRWIQPQGFVTTPFNFAQFGNQAGLSDVQAGFKFAVLASSNHYFTFQFRTYFPSGDSSKGLGTNHYSIEPSLLYYQKLTDRAAVEAQLGDWHPIGGSAGVPITNSEGFAGDIFTYGIGPSYQLYRGEHVRFTPVIELFGWRVLSGFQTEKPGDSEVSGTNIINLKAGVRTSIGNHSSFYLGFGQALTHDVWYEHIFRLEYRYSF